MADRAPVPQAKGVEETVLSHPERIGYVLVFGTLFVVMLKSLISSIRQHDIFEVWYVVTLLGMGLLGALAALIWSVAVYTVVRKGSEEITICWALGRLIRRRKYSVLLKDVTDLVARERFYSAGRGNKIRRYEILFGPERVRIELLGRLTRRHVDLLAIGVFRGMLRIEPLP